MDPTKRMFLSSLPPDVTIDELRKFIRLRTNVNPSHVDIAVDREGKQRGFAHVTVESLRVVLSAVNDVPLRGSRVKAAQAKPHFSVVVRAAKRAREEESQRTEAERQAELKEFEERQAAVRQSGKKIVFVPPSRSFFSKAADFAVISSGIATRFRQRHKERLKPSNRTGENAAKPTKKSLLPQRDTSKNDKRSKDVSLPRPIAAASAAVSVSKEDRKIASLKARLAALQSQLK